MSKPKNGGAAFPSPETENFGNEWGISARDYFAAAALTGFVAAHDASEEYVNPANCADIAYEIADAMLAERNKREAADVSD